MKPPAPVLRPMRVTDLDAVVAVEVLCYSHPWTRGNFIDSLAAGHAAELLLQPQDGLIGYFVALAGADELHLLNITVAPDWQGQGHGRRLLQAVHSRAQAQGLASLWLEVRRGNQRAQALYRRFGFAEVGLRRGYYPAAGGREDAVVMRMDAEPADTASPPAVPPREPPARHAVD